MRRFEIQALRDYEAHLPSFATEEKRRWSDRLCAFAQDDVAVTESLLHAPLEQLQDATRAAETAAAVLVVQGMVLERMRRVIYEMVSQRPNVSEATRALAKQGAAASASLVSAAEEQLAERADREPLQPLFVDASSDVLRQLDAVGESVDAIFGEPFGLGFAEIVGEFVADLIPASVRLGMDRRKILSHLAGSLMGI
jgi:hypothetical protein